ncbi:MAG: IS4 family transposase [Magnetococcales bacterium]|nr:IS4 family transposase [Magnetococcales bacterium]
MFPQQAGLPFGEVLSSETALRFLEEQKTVFRDRIFSPVVTLSAFIAQVLSEDHSCAWAVAQVNAERVAQGKKPCSPDTGAYCQARQRLPNDLILQLLRETGAKLHNDTLPGWLWRGRRLTLADGSTVSMPDTPENQAKFPQPASQKPGLGFPLARLVVLLSLATGGVLDMAVGPNKGKKTGEHALFRQVLGALNPGDILLADRYYCSYFLLAILRQMEVDAVFQVHASRKVDFRRGRRLGKRDHIVEWSKPARPDWMDLDAYEAMPPTLSIRETKVGGLVLVSTFLDPKEVTREELGDLYKLRWTVEVHLKFIKEIMKMDVLRGKSPDMVKKEIGVHLLACNLIRTVMAQAAERGGIIPNTISFKGALQQMDAFTDKIAHATGDGRARLLDAMLRAIAHRRIGNRPGRAEPRVVKRRPKPYPRMTEPRATARLSL